MLSYGMAKAMAKARRTDWNERTEITKAIITWVDAEWEYELEVENEDRMDDDSFKGWVEEYAEEFAREAAEDNDTTFEGIESIRYEEAYIDDDERFEDEYAAYCESEWEAETGR